MRVEEMFNVDNIINMTDQQLTAQLAAITKLVERNRLLLTQAEMYEAALQTEIAWREEKCKESAK